MAKPGPKPKDLSVYLEEAREERRRFPKLKANAIGNRIAAKHPEVKGLAQAIRKALKKEEKQASSTALDLPAPVPPTPNPSSPASPHPVATMPRRRFKSAAQRVHELNEKNLDNQLKLIRETFEESSALRKIVEQDEKTVEALMRDPTFMALWKMLLEGED